MSNISIIAMSAAAALLLVTTSMAITEVIPFTVEMKASHDSLAIISQRAGDVGVLILIMAAILSFFVKGVKSLLIGVAGFALIGFSYFGALPLAISMGPEIFVQSIMAEANCFPREYLSTVNSHELTPPSQEQLCNAVSR